MKHNEHRTEPDTIRQNGSPPQDHRNRKRRITLKSALYALLAVFIAVLTFCGIIFAFSALTSSSGRNASDTGEETDSQDSSGTDSSYSGVSVSADLSSYDVSAIAEQVMPSVVSITNLSVQEVQDYFGGSIELESTSVGTGIILSQEDDELYILTNEHVIEDNRSLTVTFNDSSSAEAVVKGSDSTYDIAVISVPLSSLSDETLESISAAALGDSDSLKVGEPAVAIGNALGYGQSVTSGVISALDVSGSTLSGSEDSTDVSYIQTDAAINPGNSGGPLVNSAGEVIGINTSKISSESVEGMGYAIPISDVSGLISSLIEDGTRTAVDESEQGYLGITGMNITETTSELFNMPLGVRITDLEENGPADQAGVPEGGIITGINSKEIETLAELQNELQYYAQGDTVTLTVAVLTDGEYEESDYVITLGEKS